jgi:hypothetical protein
MPLNYPDILQHNNSAYPIVDSNNILGSVFVTGSDTEQYGISEYKRKLGMIVYFSSSQDFKYYKGGTTSSGDWGTAANWEVLGSGEPVNTGSLLLTASVNLNTITFTKGDGTTQFTITVDTGSGQTYTAGDGIDIDGSNIVSAKLGAGLRFDGSTQIEATVRQVNGQDPDPVTGNISTALTAVETGTSASLVQSSSGAITGSITNGTVWVISNDGDATKNGDTYIFKSGSVGQWYQISPLDEVAADARYVRLSSTSLQTITSSLLISGSTTFSGSLFWSGASDLGGAANSVLVLGDDGQIYKTGSYGGGGGSGTPGGPLNSIQYNSASTFSGSSNFNFDGTNIINLTGSLIISGSTPLTAIGGTSTITGSLIVSSSSNVIGTSRVTGSFIVSSSTNLIGTTTITGSLIVSSSSQIIGTETITGSLIVSSSSNVIGTSRVTGSLIVSTSLSVVGTGSISGSLIVSRSTDNTATIVGSGSFNPLLNVLGSQGQLFSVYDTVSGSLFSVNDISGLPILEVKSDITTLIGSYQAPALHTTRRIVTTVGNNIIYNGIPTASYNAAIIDYNLTSASYAKVGSIMTAWSSSTITIQTEYATASVAGGNYPTMSLQILGANLIVTASAAAASWVIKTIIRSI